MFDFSITFFIFSFFTFLFKIVFHLNLKLIVRLLRQLLRLENNTRTFFFLTYLYYCVLWNCVLGSFILFLPPIYNALPLETEDFFISKALLILFFTRLNIISLLVLLVAFFLILILIDCVFLSISHIPFP